MTKHINAATRMVLDSLRTMVIWAFSLGMAWESFCYVQVIGFITLLSGTLVYNQLIKIPGIKYDDGSADDAAGKGVDPAADDPEGNYASLMDDADRELLLGGSVNAAGGKKGKR